MLRIWYFFERPDQKLQHYSLKIDVRIKSLGDLCDSGIPGHIPNPVVKAVSADGTWRATSWESRSLPRGFSILITQLSPLFDSF
jgi:hypothetical protein